MYNSRPGYMGNPYTRLVSHNGFTVLLCTISFLIPKRIIKNITWHYKVKEVWLKDVLNDS